MRKIPEEHTELLTWRLKPEVTQVTPEAEYVVDFRQQNAEQNNSVKKDNKTFERKATFKYTGRETRKSNFIREDIKKRLNSRNICKN
jgi:hypothetical protein